MTPTEMDGWYGTLDPRNTPSEKYEDKDGGEKRVGIRDCGGRDRSAIVEEEKTLQIDNVL